MVEYYNNVKERFSSYLNDESNIVQSGYADRIYFPNNENQVQDIMNKSLEQNVHITISGGGTGLSGGRVPLKGWLIATDKMKSIAVEEPELWKDPDTNQKYQVKLLEISEKEARLAIPVSMTLKSIQTYVKEKHWYYPPDTTERTSFIGGNVSTNASGARCFKFGSTRNWVSKLRIVLPDATLIELDRNKHNGTIDKEWIVIQTDNSEYRVRRPKYQLPNVTKNVAGLVITDNMHPIDLFIGTNGIFGIITEVTLKLTRPPKHIISIFSFCNSIDQALNLIEICQEQRRQNIFPVPMSVEFLDERAVKIMKLKDNRILESIKAIVMLEQDTYSDIEYEEAINYWNKKFKEIGVLDTYVAQTYQEIEHHKFLRHCVPEYVISLTKSFKQSLVATDYSVPHNKLRELFSYVIEMGEEFERYQAQNKDEDNTMGYVFFAHAGDSHIHLALIPHDEKEARYANLIMVKIMHKIVEMGGTIAAEHGLGKKTFNNKPALHLQYGAEGINDLKSIKKTLDPDFLLNPKNLIG